MLALPIVGPDKSEAYGSHDIDAAPCEATSEVHMTWGIDPMLILESLELIEGINCLGRFID